MSTGKLTGDEVTGLFVPGLAGAAGTAAAMSTISDLGDAVYIAAYLASQAKTGEIIISEDAAHATRLELTSSETRQLPLKGRSEAVDVRIIRLTGDD